MLPMIALRLQIGELLAADTTTLAPATANKVAVIVAPFALSENLVAADLTLGTTGGLAPVAGVSGAQVVGLDPATLQQTILIKPPAGGYHWLTSGASYPVNVYGYALLDSTLADVLAVTALTVPVTLTADGQLLETDPLELSIVAQPMF